MISDKSSIVRYSKAVQRNFKGSLGAGMDLRFGCPVRPGKIRPSCPFLVVWVALTFPTAKAMIDVEGGRMSTVEPIQVTHPYVERRSGVQGGRPVIKGTRFPVSSIVQNHRRGLSVEEMLRDFPHLSPAQVYDALSYCYDHQEQIDREIAELNGLDQAADDHPPTLRPADEAS